MANITLESVTKQFPDGTLAVDHVSLEIEDGEFFVLVGPSGCGKSTLLRMVAGLADMSDGTISIGERVVNELEPRERDIAMVFQDYALYPHLNVHNNLAFGLRRRKFPKAEIDGRVREVAKILGIEELLHRRPGQLSGGQRQRVAMGRAIVRQPAAFLMDEPLSNLDAKFRVQMRAELLKLHQQIRTTTIYVTHDQVEAMTMGDRVAVLRDGVLQQVDTPRRLYASPANLFVAGFIGSPAMNVVEADVAEADGTLQARFGSLVVPIPEALAAAVRASGARRIVLGLRPEAFEDAAVAPAGPLPRITVDVQLVEHLGAETVVTFDTGGRPARTADVTALLEDMDAAAIPHAEETAVFSARVSSKSAAVTGGRLELVVDVDELYFFDVETGSAIGRRGAERSEPAGATG
jgi:multiple sugar transport system ATP-binding protein